jgi:hypothetical protein
LSKKLVMTACALAVSGLALAKLPPLDDAAKAKAAETAARAAWQAKVDAFKLCKVQDRIAGQYGGKGGVVRTAAAAPGGTMGSPTSATTGMAAPSATAAPSSATAAAALDIPPTKAAAAAAATPGVNPASPAVTPPPAGAMTGAGQSGGTPVASVAAAPTIPPCADPGPFAYNPPPQIPLETSGAHSPAGNAATPPSVQPNSAQMAPAQPATPQSKKP